MDLLTEPLIIVIYCLVYLVGIALLALLIYWVVKKAIKDAYHEMAEEHAKAHAEAHRQEHCCCGHDHGDDASSEQ